MKQLNLLFLLLIMLANIQVVSSQDEDPYIWLEEVEGEEQLKWVKEQNELTKVKLDAEPGFEKLRSKYVTAFNDKDRIAFPSIVGDYVYNLWQDETNERGLWRRMPIDQYLANGTEWEEVIDLDKLSEAEDKKWVFAGANWLAPENKFCLVSLSDGGTDENIIREFNSETKEFVDGGFSFPSSKGGVSWIDKDHVLVSRDFGEGSLTTSGYPRSVKFLERNGNLEDSEIVFETAEDHVGLFGFSFYYDGKTHVFLYRGITFWESELYYFTGEKFEKVSYPKDAQIQGYFKGQLVFSLESDWFINEKVYTQGSLVSFDLNKNISGETEVNRIYVPNEKSSFVSMSSSKDFVTVNVMENVQNKLLQYTFQDWKYLPNLIKQ